MAPRAAAPGSGPRTSCEIQQKPSPAALSAWGWRGPGSLLQAYSPQGRPSREADDGRSPHLVWDPLARGEIAAVRGAAFVDRRALPVARVRIGSGRVAVVHHHRRPFLRRGPVAGRGPPRESVVR